MVATPLSRWRRPQFHGVVRGHIADDRGAATAAPGVLGIGRSRQMSSSQVTGVAHPYDLQSRDSAVRTLARFARSRSCVPAGLSETGHVDSGDELDCIEGKIPVDDS